MRAETRLGTYLDVRERAGDLAPVLDAVRDTISREMPDAVETASRREGSLWWGTGPRKMTDGVLWAMPHKAHVNLGFFRGATLADPDGRLEGTGKAFRHVKLRGVADVSDPAIVALIRAARDG